MALPGIIAFQFINMTLMSIAVILFLTKINQRYGNTYKKAKYLVGLYLILFTISFLIRAIADILILKGSFMVPLTSAWFLLFFYTFTELIPLFTLYTVHIH